jgi:hypothetical protein
MLPKILNTKDFEYPKIQIWLSGNPFYSISMLVTMKKEVNQVKGGKLVAQGEHPY